MTKASDSLPRLLVIGAGPAGVSAAIRLRDRGYEVLLVDRASFPREKICGCCLNLPALAALKKIDCDQIIFDLVDAPLARWELRLGRRIVEAALPGGIAISRWAMDAELVDEAIRRGVQVRQLCDARIVDVQPDRVTVSLRCDGSEATTCHFDVVVFAAGLSGGGVSRWLPFTHSPSGPIGVGTVLNTFAEVPAQTIQMICGPSGYVGLVRLEDGRIDLAAAIRRTKNDEASLNRTSIAMRMNGLLSAAGMPELDSAQIDQLRMTPPLTRRRQAGFGGLLAVGDAAKYVEPFTGEGMAWAIESGIEAADCIADRRDSGRQFAGTTAEEWSIRYRDLNRRRQWICRFMSTVLSSKTASHCVIPTIRVAPWAAKWIIAGLNRMPK